jgi:hypothetical protein
MNEDNQDIIDPEDTEDTIDPEEDNDVEEYEQELNDELDREIAFAFNRR